VLVKADEISLTQVFVNLVGNAVKFTPAGGQVVVQIYAREAGYDITVRDTGIGIPTEDLPNLYSRFFRGRNAIENEIPGTGIGLYIVQSIVEKHGGKLTVKSEVGKGTTFVVWMPRWAEN